MLKTKVYYDSFQGEVCDFFTTSGTKQTCKNKDSIQTGFPNTAIGWTTVNPAPNSHRWLNQCFYAA